MSDALSTEQYLREVKLDRGQRARAELISGEVNENPIMAAFEIICLRDLLEETRKSVAKAADADCVCVDGPQRCKYCAPHRALLDRIDEALSDG